MLLVRAILAESLQPIKIKNRRQKSIRNEVIMKGEKHLIL